MRRRRRRTGTPTIQWGIKARRGELLPRRSLLQEPIKKRKKELRRNPQRRGLVLLRNIKREMMVRKEEEKLKFRL